MLPPTALETVLARSLREQPPRHPESVLQRLWFEHLLPARLPLPGGHSIEIIQTGWWNREAGPDFRNAALRLPNGEIRAGDVELHLRASDWDAHGHSRDPEYNHLVLHAALEGQPRPVALASGATATTAILAPHLDAPFNELAARLPPDPAPQPPAKPGACAPALATFNEPDLRRLLAEAGFLRLRRRARRIAAQWRRDGREQTLWEWLAEALGFKENKAPFRILARRCPVAAIRPLPRLEREARLFGEAGFLPSVEISTWREANRSHAARLWRTWWAAHPRPEAPMPRHLWNLRQTRPANHPQRRVAALALLADRIPHLLRELDNSDTTAFAQRLAGLRHPFFDRHATLRAAPAPARVALLGDSRVADILVNVAAPWLIAAGIDPSTRLAHIPAPQSNRAAQIALSRLLPQRRFRPANVLELQGLLEILHTFCAADASDCRQCPFPQAAAQWQHCQRDPAG